ncbi:hypothetical protein FRC14_001714 [Serendipita sp. 396]|nr:hypothetical protein FRC14_001714 [Serendipita sp. 396]KAG8787066.1 hypothetical protein FRC16_001608 [Serendipita sp. 398]KAG8846955.1 hypothetical protein FRB91_000307 [Serendipita sp. 411]
MRFLLALYLFFLHCSHIVLGSPLGEDDAVVSRCGNELASDEVVAIEERISLDFNRLGGNATDFDSNRITTVKVIWHVIYATQTKAGGYLSPGAISGSIQAMNEHYKGSGFTFSLMAVTHTQNKDWFYNARMGSSVESEMKNTLAKGDSATLNIYSVSLPNNLLGYATFPWDYSSNQKLDGVVFLHTSIPGGTMTNYNQGKTLTHEVGHWLGLYHVFQGNSCTGFGDYVIDTPAQKTSTSGCPSSKSSCPNNGGDGFHNYMDYSYDRCLYLFTFGQRERAKRMSNMYRGLS